MSRCPLPGERAIDGDGREGTVVLLIPSRDRACLKNRNGEIFTASLSEITALDGGGLHALDSLRYPR